MLQHNLRLLRGGRCQIRDACSIPAHAAKRSKTSEPTNQPSGAHEAPPRVLLLCPPALTPSSFILNLDILMFHQLHKLGDDRDAAFALQFDHSFVVG